jgi:hypothetical protein
MMSDAFGPAATIGAEGYLTGYPLPESGHYALARTWPAPELPRPGCVWTHTILIDFSDIPSLHGAGGILKLFRRPQDDERSYGTAIEHLSTTDDDRPGMSDDFARRILSAVYGDPATPIVSAAADVPTRDALVLAIWNQQWPRLRRSFRFCTLSFADRSSANAMFDLQFLPSAGRVRPTQFKSALDADRRDFVATEWLEDAVADLKEGPDGRLRRFLRAAGSDVGGGNRSSHWRRCMRFHFTSIPIRPPSSVRYRYWNGRSRRTRGTRPARRLSKRPRPPPTVWGPKVCSSSCAISV